jgi:Flp pilus assembly secretin CpaC
MPMRTLLALLAATALATAVNAAGVVSVPVNQGLKVSVRGVAKSVVVGNPTIADVNVIDSHTVLIVGKGYGVTNVVVIDAMGASLFDSQVVVQAPDNGRVTLYRGARVSTDFACSPRCEQEPGGAGADAGASAPTPTP